MVNFNENNIVISIRLILQFIIFASLIYLVFIAFKNQDSYQIGFIPVLKKNISAGTILKKNDFNYEFHIFLPKKRGEILQENNIDNGFFAIQPLEQGKFVLLSNIASSDKVFKVMCFNEDLNKFAFEALKKNDEVVLLDMNDLEVKPAKYCIIQEYKLKNDLIKHNSLIKHFEVEGKNGKSIYIELLAIE